MFMFKKNLLIKKIALSMLFITLMGINFNLGAVSGEPHDQRSSTDFFLDEVPLIDTVFGETTSYNQQALWRFSANSNIVVTDVGAIMRLDPESSGDEGFKFNLYSLVNAFDDPLSPGATIIGSSDTFSIGTPEAGDDYLERTVALSASLTSGNTYALVLSSTIFDNFGGIRAISNPTVGSDFLILSEGSWQFLNEDYSTSHMFIESNIAIPEPSTYLTLGSMLLTLAVMKRRKKSVA